MRLLLDTHVVLWQLSTEPALSPAAREVILAADDLLISTVSFAEIGVKVSVGKLDVPPDFEQAVRALGLSAAPSARAAQPAAATSRLLAAPHPPPPCLCPPVPCPGVSERPARWWDGPQPGSHPRR